MTDSRWWDRTERLGADLVWLAVLDWPNAPTYLAQDHIEAPDPDSGATVAYAGGLGEVEWSEEVALWDASPQSRGATFALHLDEVTGPPALIAAGHNLHGARFRLYRHIRGTSRMVLYIDGRVQDFVYGDPSQPSLISVNVESNPWEDGATTHDPDERITTASWSGANERVQGEAYPFVFGRPGFLGVNPATPALPIKSDVVLVSTGKTIADKVDIYDKDRNRRIGCDLIQEADGNGRIVSTADVTTGAGTAITWADDEVFYARFAAYTAARPGTLTDLNQAPITTAGDLLEWAVNRTAGGWDRAGVSSAARLLDGFRVDGAIMPPADRLLTIWEWLSGTLLPLLPVSLVWSPSGASLKVWRWDDFQPLATIVEGRDAHRFGSVRIGRIDSLYNEHRLNYRRDADVGDSVKAVVMAGSDEAASRETGAVLNRKCEVSQTRYRTRDGRRLVRRNEVTTAIVEDDATARAAVRWWAEAQALPLSRVTLDAEGYWGWLRVGDEVAYTDATLGWTERRAVLSSITYRDDGALTWTLAVFDRAHTS